MPNGVPVASGAILVTASMKRVSTASLLESPFGEIETSARPSAVIQSRSRSGGNVGEGDRLGRQRALDLRRAWSRTAP